MLLQQQLNEREKELLIQKERIYKGKSKNRSRTGSEVGASKSQTRSPHDLLYDNQVIRGKQQTS